MISFFTFQTEHWKPDAGIPGFDYNWLTTKKNRSARFLGSGLSEQTSLVSSIMNWTRKADFICENLKPRGQNKEFISSYRPHLNESLSSTTKKMLKRFGRLTYCHGWDVWSQMS